MPSKDPRHQELVDTTIAFLKDHFRHAEGGHDWHHTERVWKLAKHIAEHESGTNMTIVELGALLHDVADAKFHNGDEEVAPRVAREHLSSLGAPDTVIDGVIDIIRNISWKSNLGSDRKPSLELAIVQDVDRLEAIGAVGIARTFCYSGHKGRPMYDPDIPPNLNLTKEEYKKGDSTTINHFYEKLLLVKDKMNTETGKHLAAARHAYMEAFLEQFLAETRGER